MVYFVCNHCGESLKKASVEKHYTQQCRGAMKNVSCMDCSKDFHGEDYVAHTKCISEAEKYSGKDFVPKANGNKGEKKQEQWMDIVRSILESSEYKLSAEQRQAFQKLQSMNNVPRKQDKFINFMLKCLRYQKRIAQGVWTILEAYAKNTMPAKAAPIKAAGGKSAKELPADETKMDDNEETQIRTNEKSSPKKTPNGKAKAVTKDKDKDEDDGEKIVGINSGPIKESPVKTKKLKGKKRKAQTAAATDSAVAIAKVVKTEPDQLSPPNEDAQPPQKKKTVDSAVARTKAKKRKAEQSSTAGKSNEAKASDDTAVPKKKAKKKLKKSTVKPEDECAKDNNEKEDNGKKEAFLWCDVISKIVATHESGIAVNELRMEVMKKCRSSNGIEMDDMAVSKTFDKKFKKKLKKCADVKVEDDIVKKC